MATGPKNKPPTAAPEPTAAEAKAAADAETLRQNAADAAVDEVAAETDTEQVIEFEFGGEKYAFKAKRLNAMQFRGLMQKGQDAVATEWLLGGLQYATFLLSNADDDGCTPREAFLDLLAEIGKAAGSPNS